MAGKDNPYANALDGLVLEDPVAAFFDFCRAREAIRRLRDSGAPPPWSEDIIFQRGRFLNVFREDDRVTQAIMRFAAPVADDLPSLIHALFFARWCNRASTLERLTYAVLTEPEQLQARLQAMSDQPWCNVTAYPVEPLSWQGRRWSRLEAATSLFARIKTALAAAIGGARGDVVAATRAVNAHFEMGNDFPIFMAVMDVAWFRPDVIDPASPVPTGIGAVTFLDRLQQHLGLADHHQTCQRMISLQPAYWPEAKRAFHPIDIEYLACECRKYYSYVCGSKRFEGKNVFQPGQSAQLCFDVDERCDADVQTRIHVLAGGPCSGKTTLLNALADAGYRVVQETAERVLKAGIAAGATAAQMRMEPVKWQTELLRQDYALFEGLEVDELVLTDTSFLETLVFGERAGIAMGANVESWLRRKRYAKVFFLEPVRAYEQSAVRTESEVLARQISAQELAAYRRYGYEVVAVPKAPIAERMAFILSAIEGE